MRTYMVFDLVLQSILKLFSYSGIVYTADAQILTSLTSLFQNVFAWELDSAMAYKTVIWSNLIESEMSPLKQNIGNSYISWRLIERNFPVISG